MSDLLHKLSEAVLEGDEDLAASLVQSLILQGENAKVILNKGMMPGMDEVALKFGEGDMFIPEVLSSARAMQAGNDLLRTLLVKDNVGKKGKIVIGTVEGDMHDIGKKIVGMMLEGAGFEIIDLGMDVSAAKFIEAVKEEKPNIVGMSAMLTTTMPAMQEVVETLKEEGLDKEVIVMIGGAPVSDAYAKSIGVHYSYDAASAIELANKLIGYTR